MKRILKWFGKLFLALILILLILWAIILGTLQTKSGQDWAFNKAMGYFEQATHTKIQVRKFYFSFPLSLRLEDVVFLKDDRPILMINKFELCCTYTTLLQGRIIFSRLSVDNIHILELPNKTEQPQDEVPRAWETPLLPFYVKIENLDVQQLKLDSDIVKRLKLPLEIESIIQQSSFNLNGLISNNPFKSALTAHLLITAKNDHRNITPFSVGIDTQNHQLSLSLHSNQLPLQVIQANLPAYLKGNLALYATAPISTWQEMIQDPENNEKTIEGNFKLTLKSLKDTPAHPITTLIGQQTVLKGHYLLNSKSAIELIDVKVENPSIALTGAAIVNANKTIEEAHFQGTVNDLIRYQQWLGKAVQGQLSFEGHVSGNVLSPLFVLNIESPELFVADQSFQHISSSFRTTPQEQNLNGFFTLSFKYKDIPWKASSSFDWNNQNQLTLSQFQMNGLGSNLHGELSCSSPDFIWDGFVEAYFDNLSNLSPFIAIPLNGEGQIKLELNSVANATNQHKQQAIRAEITGRALQWTDWKSQEIVLNVELDPSIEKINLLHVKGTLNGSKLQWKDYFAGQYAAHFTHHIEPTLYNITHLFTQWEAQDIHWPAGKLSKAVGKLEIENPFQPMEGRIEFAVSELKTSSMQFQELSGSTTLHGDQMLWPFQLRGQGAWKEDLLFAIDGQWHYQQDDLQIEAQRLTGRFGPYPLNLKQSLHFHQNPEKTQLGSFWLQWGEAEIQGDFHQDKQNILSHLKTNAVPSELFHFISPDLPLTGRASFQGNLAGPIHQPKGQFEIDLHNIQITEDVFAKKPFIAGKLFLSLDEKGVQLKSELKGIGNGPLLIEGQLPFSLNLDPMSYKLNPELPFNLSLKAEGELDPFLHLLYNDTTNLSGHAKIALNFSGQITAPQVKGQIDLIDGAFESLSTGALYHNIQAHLEGDGSKILLTKLSAQDSKNGQISATGTISLDASKQFPFEFEVKPSHIFILDSDYVDISASGRLYLVGNTKSSKLQGELTVDQASINLDASLPASIKNIDIKYLNIAENDPVPHYFEKREGTSPLELEVKLNAPQSVLIEGNHLKSEWKGSFLVTGNPDNVQLHGDMRITKGEYNFNGKVFNLSQGNIHFAGAPDKKTSLYIVATKEIEKITAEIIVKGPVTKPVISFRSNPPLSQREVLSYILFNRGISDITPDQGDQLSQSFMSLNSSEQTKSSDDFLSRLRNNIGIDHLDFTTNDNKENKDFGVQVGKHITKDVMVTVSQSMVSLSPVIAVEAKLRKNIKAQAEAGVAQDAPIRMSIKWKKDY